MDTSKDILEKKDKTESSVEALVLANSSKDSSKSWSCRQFVVLLFSIGAVVLAYFDPSFRPTYGNLVNLTVGGYLGQMLPRKRE